MTDIVVGTSGYSFRDWVGPFYPPGTRAADFLGYYATQFPAVEINATYYAIPRPEVMARMADKTPDDFRFLVKLHQDMTHARSLEPELYREFAAALRPLQDAGKYDGLLAQFPGSFRRTPENRRFLAALRDRLVDEPLFVEFRHDSWLTPELEPALKARRIGFCAVDEPALGHLMPATTLCTSEDAYVRFHGRNAANWWGRGGGDRYDYDYRPDELEGWLGRIRDLADRSRRVYLFFNNCHAGQAARSAKLMQEMLRQQGLAVREVRRPPVVGR